MTPISGVANSRRAHLHHAASATFAASWFQPRTVALAATLTALALLPPSPAAAQTCDDWGSWNFFQSASAGQVAACLRSGADPDARENLGPTPLHRASLHATDPAVVAVLVEFGADLNARDSDAATPLHHAWGNSNPEVVRELLRLGADPTARDKLGRLADPTHCDYWNRWMFGRVALAPDVARCIESGADPQARDENGNTPLHHAILGIPLEREPAYLPGARRPERAPDLAVIVRLIESGSDPRTSNDHGDTPLHFAARAGDQAIARFLLEAGADADARDRQGNSPLHEAARAENPAMIALLLEMGVAVEVHGTDGSTPFHLALRQWGSSLAVAETLLEAGADVNARNRQGRTSLHLAVAEWHNLDPAVLRRFLASLLSSGADPDVQDNMGRTPLHLAAYREDPSLAATLLEAGADVTLRIESVRGCLEKGTDPNARDEYGGTPLHRLVGPGPWPANASPLPAILALLTAGADVNARSLRGTTPLHSAAGAAEDRIEIAAALIEAGADIHAVDDEGATPLHAAAASGAPPYISWLVDNGADVAARDARRPHPRSTRPPRPTIPAPPTHCWPGERIPAHSTLRGRPQIRRHASTGTPRRSPWRPMRRWSRRASTWEPTRARDGSGGRVVTGEAMSRPFTSLPHGPATPL